MATSSSLDPSRRQVLVNLGNRYAVFGPSLGLPQPTRFDPETDSEVLPRVTDESEVAEARITQTLRVHGMKTSVLREEPSQADLELRDDDGNRVLVDIMVRERDPKQRDYEQGDHLVREAANAGKALEVWYFNIERLKLVVMSRDQSGLQLNEMIPLDVWEKNEDGLFTRAKVVEEVEDWIRRVHIFYDQVQAWLGDQPGLRCERSRSVTMSEELMRKFAVADREIPLLDVFDANQVIASFVPRELWLIWSWGRIDVITRTQTQTLLAVRDQGNLVWKLVSPGDRRQKKPFDKQALLALIGQS